MQPCHLLTLRMDNGNAVDSAHVKLDVVDVTAEPTQAQMTRRTSFSTNKFTLGVFKRKIAEFRLSSVTVKLDEPLGVNMASPTADVVCLAGLALRAGFVCRLQRCVMDHTRTHARTHNLRARTQPTCSHTPPLDYHPCLRARVGEHIIRTARHGTTTTAAADRSTWFAACAGGGSLTCRVPCAGVAGEVVIASPAGVLARRRFAGCYEPTCVSWHPAGGLVLIAYNAGILCVDVTLSRFYLNTFHDKEGTAKLAACGFLSCIHIESAFCRAYNRGCSVLF